MVILRRFVARTFLGNLEISLHLVFLKILFDRNSLVSVHLLIGDSLTHIVGFLMFQVLLRYVIFLDTPIFSDTPK